MLGLDPPPHRVEAAVGQRDHVEGVDHLVGPGQHHRVHRRIGVGHVEGAEADALSPATGLFVQPAGHFGEVAGGEDVDDLVVLDIGHGGGVVGMAPAAQAYELGLVEPDGSGAVEAFAVRLEQGLSIGGDGVVHGVPVTGQFRRHLRDRPPPSHLDRGPLGRPGREQAVLRGNAVVVEHPAPLCTAGVHTAHGVLLPRQRHGCAIDRQLDVVDDRALFDPGSLPTRRTSNLLDDLLDHELDLAAIADVGEDPDVFETHQGPDDLDRVSEDEGASGKLAHTTTLEHLRRLLGDLRQGATPLRSEEAHSWRPILGAPCSAPLQRALQRAPVR